ncbi:MAG: formate C-acetyltransferase [Mycoplasmataceae bacterium]|nr:formate C-acetyltransferase [Mycoplasmataceae bacterium]
MAKYWYKEWEKFNAGSWCDEINVRDFIQRNYTPYTGNDSFLKKPTTSTKKLWQKTMEISEKEKKAGGVLAMDERVSFIDAYGPGYLDKKLEKIVGIQTDEPFKRAYMPIGGVKMAQQAAESFGFKTDTRLDEIYTKYRKTHNQGVFDTYTDEMKKARHLHILTGLPDAYSRGRIIGDYRRIALYGIDFLIKMKKVDRSITPYDMDDEAIRLREENTDQIKALQAMKRMAAAYGHDISKPARNTQEAIQWTYYGYLAAIKDQNGAAMSIGRIDTFFDIFIERDLKSKKITEEQVQELIDHFVMKLRIVKYMRTAEYNEIFAGDPIWATVSVAGQGIDGRTLVTKSSFRLIHTLANMGPAPEPNLTVLWSTRLPKSFKEFCAKYSILYSSIQYENDDLMRVTHGDDYGIACCVSPMKIGKQMQFFGARANLAKALLYAINGGFDEIHPDYQIGPRQGQLDITKPLDFDEIWERYKIVLRWLASLYVKTLNIIHYMHDKYYYEAGQMALCDYNIHRFFATGIAGLSVVADSLSAIKYAKVYPVWERIGSSDRYFARDYKVEGDYPKYGNDNDNVDALATDVVKMFVNMLKRHKTYRNSELTTSVLTITSNVMYGKNTGSTPDGRKGGMPFAPGANPMHGRDDSGAIASLASVAKIPFEYAADGISNTFSIIPNALGKDDDLILSDNELDIDNVRKAKKHIKKNKVVKSKRRIKK